MAIKRVAAQALLLALPQSVAKRQQAISHSFGKLAEHHNHHQELPQKSAVETHIVVAALQAHRVACRGRHKVAGFACVCIRGVWQLVMLWCTGGCFDVITVLVK